MSPFNALDRQRAVRGMWHYMVVWGLYLVMVTRTRTTVPLLLHPTYVRMRTDENNRLMLVRHPVGTVVARHLGFVHSVPYHKIRENKP